jgi:hypothetical protein
MKKIETIWTELEATATKGGGIVYRRYSVDVVPMLFVAVRRADLNRCLALVFTDREAAKQVEKVAIKGLEFDVQVNSNFPNQFLLLIVLSDRKNENVFSTLAEDLIEVVAKESSESRVIVSILRRILIWKSLFDETMIDGLSLDAQVGLFGELTLLKTMMDSNKRSVSICIESWVGPESGNRDFEIGGWAAEVKATRSNQHQKVAISSERQLDNTHLDRLFLCCYSFDAQKSAGTTLNYLVSELRILLDLHPTELISFERKLVLAGYLEKHNSKYEEYGFKERSHDFFLVTDSFPSIREADLPNGVGDVKYSIMLSSITNFATDLSHLLS